MNFTEKVAPAVAEAEVNKYLDSRIILPKRREALQPAIESVVEAVSLGYISFADDGTITQTLIQPIGETTELIYKKNVDAATMQKAISGVKIYNQTNVNTCYISAYTGLLKAQVDKMEPADRNIAESIAFFFQ